MGVAVELAAQTLKTALNLSVRNVPALAGRTLVLTDTSASMTGPVSEEASLGGSPPGTSSLRRVEPRPRDLDRSPSPCTERCRLVR